MSAQSPMLQQANLLTGRQWTMLVIIALHALVITALMAMRIVPDVVKVPPPITGRIDPPEQLVPPPPPPDLPVTLEKPDFTIQQIPMPDIVIPVEPVRTPYVAPAETGPVAPVVPQGATGDSNVVPAIPTTALQYRVVRPADDYYPAASLQLREEGTAIVQVCVAPSGRIEGAPTILTSSGSSRLDAAALKWAREALRFTPATQGGVPVSACRGFRVHFRMK